MSQIETVVSLLRSFLLLADPLALIGSNDSAVPIRPLDCTGQSLNPETESGRVSGPVGGMSNE
jgi:hypothetical protein